MAPKGIRYQSLEPVNVTLYGKKGLCRHDEVKDLEMVRLSWIIQVSPKCGNIYLYRRAGGGEVTQTEEEKAAWLWKQRED